MKYSKIIVLLVILLNIVFTTAVLLLFLIKGEEPAILVGAWFTFTTGELWALAVIKSKEIKKGAEEEKEEDKEDVSSAGDDEVITKL